MSLVILSEHLLSINPHKNIFLSSISIAIALAMTYNGSSGMTKNKIAETLGIQEKSLHQIIKANADLSRKLLGSDQEKIILANSLWIKEGVILKDLFKRNISKEEYADDDGPPILIYRLVDGYQVPPSVRTRCLPYSEPIFINVSSMMNSLIFFLFPFKYLFRFILLFVSKSRLIDT